MNLTRNLAVISAFLIAAAAITSCEKDEGMLSAENGIASLKSTVLPDCETTCLQDGPFYQVTSETIQWGNTSRPYSRTITSTVWNDEEQLNFTVVSTGTTYVQYGSGQNKYYQEEPAPYPIDQVVITYTTGTVTTVLTFEYTNISPLPENVDISIELPAGWQACDAYTYQVRIEGNGQSVETQPVTYHLYAPCLCEAGFTGMTSFCGNTYFPTLEQNGLTYYLLGNRMADFTYVPEQAGYAVIQGGLTGGTTLVWSGGGLPLNSNHSQSGGPNNVQRYEGYVTACNSYLFRVIWNSTNTADLITGTWTARLYTDATQAVLLSELQLDPLSCDDLQTGYEP